LLYDIDLYAKSKLKTIKHARAIKQAFSANPERTLDCTLVIYSDKTDFFSQSERALDCIYVIYFDKTGFFSQSERALDCISVIILGLRAT
jgi:hypothetical protein